MNGCDKMKNHLILATVLSVTALCAAAMLADSPTERRSAVTVPQTTTSYLFILRDFEGKIALYENGKSSPSEIYEIYTDSLPAADATRLRTGIAAKNDAELLRLLEDYLS